MRIFHLRMMKKPYFGSRKHDPLAPSLYPTGDAGIFIHVSKVAIQKQSPIFIIKMTKDAYSNIQLQLQSKKPITSVWTSSLSLY